MNWVLTLLAGVAGWQLAARWKLPAPAMLGSMLAVGLTNILFDYAALPMAVKVFAQAISGAFIGMQIGRKDVARRFCFFVIRSMPGWNPGFMLKEKDSSFVSAYAGRRRR